MKVKATPIRLLRRTGHRLDCGPYTSGAIELTERLSRMDHSPLVELTTGCHGGIYRPPIFGMRFAQNVVQSPDHGVPFVNGSTMLQADLSYVPLIRRAVAESKKFSALRLEYGMTLISCSGAIGRAAFVRESMDGMWSSQAVMKIRPDPSKIRPGYLYAFLSSDTGTILAQAGTYGALVPQIEQEHLTALPVPRLPDPAEERIHEYVVSAARRLTKYSEQMGTATQLLLDAAGLCEPDEATWGSDGRRFGWSEDALSSLSFRALNYDPRAVDIRKTILASANAPLGSLCQPEHFKGKIIFKRLDAEPGHGVMLLGQRNAFHMRPDGRWLARKSIDGLGLVVPPGTTLVPSHGTLGPFELYCRALLVTPKTSAYAYSGDFFRCVPREDLVRSGYLYAFLRSRCAFHLLRSISAGGKQQEQHPAMMWNLPVPRLAEELEVQIANLVHEAADNYDLALAEEDEARALVERFLREAA